MSDDDKKMVKILTALDKASPNYTCRGAFTHETYAGPVNIADMVPKSDDSKHKLVRFVVDSMSVTVALPRGERRVMFE